jgi:site-specific DNA-cytosine methylase
VCCPYTRAYSLNKLLMIFRTTAYGALATVPGDVDLLVAGTSCVDYSNLNNEKKTIDGGGESGRTFHGMMSWVTNHRPPLVILENVCSAPWDRVKEYFEKHGYSAEHIKVDTKQYYIPHTRMRKYLLAVDKRGSSIPAMWKALVVNKLKRPASSTLDAFLLPSDDSRIHQARQLLVQDPSGASDSRAGRTDWTRCESRHARARLEEGLGQKRPLTSWEEGRHPSSFQGFTLADVVTGGTCRLPDFAWQDWGVRQVERVWDLMDISLIRSAKIGVDSSYKTFVTHPIYVTFISG